MWLFDSGLEQTVPQEWENVTAMTDFCLIGNSLAAGWLPNVTNWHELSCFFIHQIELIGTFPEEL